MDCGTVTKALFFIGIGVITVSGFLVGVMYSRNVDKVPDTHIEKLRMKISYDGTKEIWDSGLSIAVLGFLAFAAAAATIVLSMFLDNGMVIMICGIITAVFTLGCVIAEGLYSDYAVKQLVKETTTYSHSHNHKSAQNYIKEAIEELYNHALDNLGKKYPDYNKDQVATWSQVKDKLGKADPTRIVTYRNIWSSSYNNYGTFLKLYRSGEYIMARSPITGQSPFAVASLKFSKNVKFDDLPDYKERICWYNSDKTDIKCKTFKCEIDYDEEEIGDSYEEKFSIDSDFTLSEDVVVGDYTNNASLANYRVNGFPIAYALCDHNAEYENPIFREDSRHFKVSGKSLVNAQYKDVRDSYKVDKFGSFYLAPEEPSSCKNAWEMCESDKYEPYDDSVCEEDLTFEDLVPIFKKNYKDGNKGKVPPSINKYYNSYARNSLKKDTWMDSKDLYNFAIINMSAQLFGILLWALGTFIPGGYASVGNAL